jgi:hypothetical protein
VHQKNKLSLTVFSALIIFCAYAHSQTEAPTELMPANFTFALIGDLSYLPTQEKNLINVMDDLQKTSLAFVVHDGDLGSPPFGSCSDTFQAKRLAQFQASNHPLIYTPGDNDWTDCHATAGAPGFDPLERLANLRNNFFSSDESLGKNKIVLTRQSKTDANFKKYGENARWVYGNIMFLTLHVVGSNNNLGRAPESDAEYKERNAANLTWLSEGFAQARKNNNRAIMIIQQANIFPDFSPFKQLAAGQISGFADELALLEKETLAFKKPVVLVHGDSHYFRIDKPMGPRGRFETTPIIENFTRIETFGQPNHHWVQIFVDENDSQVFTFKPRIVTANVVEH